MKAAVCLHNYILLQNNRNYATPDLVDRILPNDTVLPGTWRQEESVFQPLGRCGTNNYAIQAGYVRNTFKDYFNGEGSAEWQWGRM